MKTRLGTNGLLSDDARTVACFEELGCRYRARNPQGRRVLRYRVDGCMLTRGEVCDFALCVPSFGTVCFVELKGSDLKKAASQLRSTIESLRETMSPYVVHARVVLRRVQRPDLRCSQLLALERWLARQGGTMQRCTISLEECIERMNPRGGG